VWFILKTDTISFQMPYKQAIVVRNDLKMGKGKIAAQSSHAAVAAFLKAPMIARSAWVASGQKKVVLRVGSESELRALLAAAHRAKLPAELIVDRGLTQLEPGTATALGIGPASDDKIDAITGKIKLL
jgi:PTH2 family peptidyl-tRNA hydrolase